MAAIRPRSVADATRFTSTIPHATRRANPGSSANPTSPRFQSPGGAPGGRPPRSSPPSSSSFAGETPEQKVARLRAAHLAAKNAQVSRLDQFVSSSRRMFDSAHRVTIVGLIGFTAIATLVTAYTAVDMMRYNRKRKGEFLAAQAQMEADSLEAARLAFMRGDATPEQAAMVEEAAEEERAAAAAAARASGSSTPGASSTSSHSSSSFFKVPSLLGAPSPVSTESATTPSSSSSSPTTSAPKSSWLGTTLAREEQGETPGSDQSRLGYESLSEEDDGSGVRDSDIVRAVEEHKSYLATKAQAAVERERANQRNGGPLDKLGVESPASGKSWWRFW